jgi:hypothetical protein
MRIAEGIRRDAKRVSLTKYGPGGQNDRFMRKM